MTKKLPPAKDWRNRDIDDWNTLTFTEYLKAKHFELFGIEYVPMRSWRMEQGLIGNLIGTRTKQGTHSKAIVKRFIDEAFESYRPTQQYPGTSFGFIYAYRRNILQRLEAEEVRSERASDDLARNWDEIADWL